MHRTIPARLAGLALLAAALLLLPAAPARAQAAVTVVAGPTAGVVEVRATGFEADEGLSAWLTGPSEQVQAVEGPGGGRRRRSRASPCASRATSRPAAGRSPSTGSTAARRRSAPSRWRRAGRT